MDQELEISLQQQLERVKLPSLPAVAIQLIGLGRSEHVDVRHLAEIVQQDPALTATILRLANSAAYRRVRQADTLTLATSYLGFETSRMIALSATVVPVLAGSREPAFCYQGFWRRALLAAACARAIARRHFSREGEALALAALIQDVGVLALAQLPQAIYAATEDCEGYLHDRLIEQEMATLGVDHALVGGWLLGRWGFPKHLQRAVELSNTSATGDVRDKPVTFDSAVSAAGLLADVWTWSDAPQRLPWLKSRICGVLQCDWPGVIKLINDAAEELPAIEAMCRLQLFDADWLHMALSALAEQPRGAAPPTGP